MINRTRLLLAAVLLAACGSEPSGETARGTAPDTAAAAPAPDAVPADTPPPAPGAAARSIVLLPGGLGVLGGPARVELAFGSPQAQVMTELGALLGPPAQQGIQEECPAGPLYHALYPAGLQAVFQDSAFVGWAAREGSTFRTAPGIGPGSTLGQLKAAYPAATVQETSLGIEFAAGDLYGIVTGASDAGAVEMMFAGINCIFR